LKNVDQLIDAMTIEIKDRAGELANQLVETIYFGGGTPSVLTETQLSAIISAIRINYNVNELIEFTLEANPEDINSENLELWRNLGVNRLSIGLQSLSNVELQKMNRAHTADDSKKAVELSLLGGFDKITIDLIYGTPWKSDSEWTDELDWALNSGINHLSAYALTIEPKTLLFHLVNKKEITPSSDEKVESQFFILQNKIQEFEWDAYEISNYCKPNHQALHNSNYWTGKAYLGIGPAAHSYNGHQRRWNVANNAFYIDAIENKKSYFEIEDLTIENQLNEYIMTQLRTKKGLDIQHLLKTEPNWLKNNKSKLDTLLQNKHIALNSTHCYLTNSGKLISDYIISELMI
jgi:oxygen-independent coproporphyrinogen-3 oxidase